MASAQAQALASEAPLAEVLEAVAAQRDQEVELLQVAQIDLVPAAFGEQPVDVQLVLQLVLQLVPQLQD